MSKLEKYQAEAEEDCRVDLVNIQDKQLLLPNVKHKWVARLINEKKNLKNLKFQRDKELNKVVEKIIKQSPVGVSNISAQSAALKHESIKKITEDIEDIQNCIDYLEKLEKVFSSMTWDLKNAIEIMKMETM